MNYDVRGRQRYLQVQVTLMLRDNAAVQSIELHQPSIRNTLVGLFSGQVFEDLQTPEGRELLRQDALRGVQRDRKSTRLNSSHVAISYAVFCLKKKTHQNTRIPHKYQLTRDQQLRRREPLH